MASILIFYQDKPTELLRNKIQLDRAKKFCNLQVTHDAQYHTWFCGFTNDNDTGHPLCSDRNLCTRLNKVYVDMR
jgi:hypothetical protein